MLNVSTATASTQPEEPTTSRGGNAVVILLLAASVILGVFAYWRFSTSARYLSAAMQEFHTRGGSMTPDQCVDETIAFSERCEAMASLCESTAPRLTEECLGAQDRTAWCASLGDAPKATSFGVAECKARHVDTRTKKSCASAYRGIATYCAKLRGELP